MPRVESLLDDGHEHVDRHGDPDLRLDCVLAGTEEDLDAKMLLANNDVELWRLDFARVTKKLPAARRR